VLKDTENRRDKYERGSYLAKMKYTFKLFTYMALMRERILDPTGIIENFVSL
jgi:hypothetical protein